MHISPYLLGLLIKLMHPIKYNLINAHYKLIKLMHIAPY